MGNKTDGCMAHHKNEVKTDGSPTNFEEKARGEHTALHHTKKFQKCSQSTFARNDYGKYK